MVHSQKSVYVGDVYVYPQKCSDLFSIILLRGISGRIGSACLSNSVSQPLFAIWLMESKDVERLGMVCSILESWC